MCGLSATLFVLSLTVFLTTDVHGQTYNDTAQLMTNLFSNYNRAIRPVIDQTKAVTIDSLMLLGAIRSVDNKEQTISIRIYTWLWWQDELLTWTPSDYGNITVINPLISELWIPTLNLAGSVTDQQLLIDTGDTVPLFVNYTGTVIWQANLFLEQLCKMDMTKFPMDEHNCTFLIYTVATSTDQILLRSSSPNLDLRRYDENGEWELASTSVSLFTFNNGVAPAFYYVRLSLIIRRRPAYFMLNLMVPTLALSFLNILVFILPADSGEKVGYSITVLLSVMLMMGLTSDFLPESSDVVPLITQFLCALTTISVLSVIATVAILCIHHKQENDSKKKQSTLSFIEISEIKSETVTEKLKQKVRSKSSVSPSNKKRNDSQQATPRDQWVSKPQNGHATQTSQERNGSVITPVDQLESEELKPGNGYLHSNNKQLAFVEAMQSEQRCIMMDPPADNDINYKPPDQFYSMSKDPQQQTAGKDRLGAGGIASLWFRGKQNGGGDKSRANSSKPSKPAESSAAGGEKSKTDEFFKEVSEHLDTIFFWLFLTAWATLTLGFMIAIGT